MGLDWTRNHSLLIRPHAIQAKKKSILRIRGKAKTDIFNEVREISLIRARGAREPQRLRGRRPSTRVVISIFPFVFSGKQNEPTGFDPSISPSVPCSAPEGQRKSSPSIAPSSFCSPRADDGLVRAVAAAVAVGDPPGISSPIEAQLRVLRLRRVRSGADQGVRRQGAQRLPVDLSHRPHRLSGRETGQAGEALDRREQDPRTSLAFLLRPLQADLEGESRR